MSVISNSVSGLRTAELRASVAATNIANTSTHNFNALEYAQTSDATGGTQARVTTRQPATAKTIDGEGNEVATPNLSLEDDLVNLQLAVNDFSANALVLRTQKKLQGALVDIFA